MTYFKLKIPTLYAKNQTCILKFLPSTKHISSFEKVNILCKMILKYTYMQKTTALSLSKNNLYTVYALQTELHTLILDLFTKH